MEHLCLLLVFIPASLSLQCWNQNTDQGSLYLQMCTTNQTSCVASYHVEGDITTATYFACSSPASSRSCLHQECNPMGASGNIYSCCCRGDLCNTVPGLTPNMVVPSSVPSTSPSGPVPTVEDGVCVCVCVCVWEEVVHLSPYHTYMYMYTFPLHPPNLPFLLPSFPPSFPPSNSHPLSLPPSPSPSP